MDEPPGQPSPYPPASLRTRALARAADTGIALLPFALLGLTHRPLTAAVGAVALTLCNDRLYAPGRSIGKQIFGLRCIVLETRTLCGITASMKRNAALALALLPAADGEVRGYWLAAVAFAAVVVSETISIITPLEHLRDLGRRRIGDVAAGTQVIDASIPIGLPVFPAPSVRNRVPASKPALGTQHRGDAPRRLAARHGPGVRSPHAGRHEGAACDSP